MTGTDVPEEDRLAEAVVRGLRKGAGASDGAAAIVEPITRDVPVGNLSHEDLQANIIVLKKSPPHSVSRQSSKRDGLFDARTVHRPELVVAGG